jgi:predicted RNA-binding Zn-ribbon protein involved in translation (DUF1610 family)
MQVAQTGLREFCHRCGAELPAREWAGDGGFFCPQCGAPQILLPEEMRIEIPEPSLLQESTGHLPPPLVRAVHWRTAIRYAALVAAVGAGLTALGTVSNFASFLSFLWIVSAGVITLGFYRKQKPAGRMSVGVGFRIGIVTGVLMTTALAAVFAGAGVVSRFGLHRMGGFDAQVQVLEGQMTERMQDQQQSPEVMAEAKRMMQSAEVRGGVAVVYLGVMGAMLMAFSAGGGAFAGMLGTRRRATQGAQ